VRGRAGRPAKEARQAFIKRSALSGIAIGLAVYAAGAHSGRPESTSHLFGFLFVQLPCTFANQHSVLVIHTFLLSRIWVRCRAQALKKKSLRAALLRRTARGGTLPNAAAFSGIAIGAAGEIKGARGQGMDSAAHLCDLLFVQLSCILAKQHSVLVIHVHLPF
jgi:hypothetical protein